MRMRQSTLLLLIALGLFGLSLVCSAQDMDEPEEHDDAARKAEKAALEAAEKAKEKPGIAPVDFERQILPILRERCFDCHSDAKKKPKAGLRLDGKNWILAGAKGKRTVIPGKPKISPLFLRAAMYEEEEDVMPPDGRTLQPKPLRLVERWIEEGANFGKWTGKGGIDAPPPLPKEVERPKRPNPFDVYKRLGKDLVPAPDTEIKKAREAGARISPVFPGSPLLRVEFVSRTDAVIDANLKVLSGLRKHVTILTLRGAAITDAAMIEIGKLPNLTRLDVQKTVITDAGLKTLTKAKQPEITHLNLYGTHVTDAGLDSLHYKLLEKIYISNTKVTAAGADMLGKRLPYCEVVWKIELPQGESGGAGKADKGRRKGKNKKK